MITKPHYTRRLYQLVMGALLLPVSGLYAQFSTDYLKAADRYFAKADYSSAAVYYQKYLHAGKAAAANGSDPYAITAVAVQTAPVTNRVAAIYRLAESYRLQTDYASATPLYQQVLLADANAFPLALFYYAAGKRAQKAYATADSAFTAFVKQHTAQDAWRKQAQAELDNLQFIQQQLNKQDTGRYVFTRLAAGKEGASYAPVWRNATTLLFTATWPEAGAGHANRLYQAGYADGSLTGIVPAGLPETDAHQGAATVSEDGRTVYFTAWNTQKGKKAAAIYITRNLQGTAWSKPELLDTMVNKPGYNAQQPVLLPGGKYLLYVSDRPGGYGNYDLWCATLDASGHIVSAANMGNTLNTAGNEQAPYYYQPSGALVFATDGRTGMGGYDLFYSKGAPGHWDSPVNFGYPVNSVKDDMYFTSLGKGNDMLEHAIISSDRSAVCCLELMAVRTVAPVVVKQPRPLVTVTQPVADSLPAPVTPVFTSHILENVYYAINSAELQPVSFGTLDQLADTLQKYPQLVIEIGGHTDSTGTAAFNKTLSQQRAANVAAYLVSKGIAQNRVTAKGYGAEQPVAPNTKPDGSDNPEGREKNRRTELKILKQ